MAIVKPFRGFRPLGELVHQIVSRPYDVLNSEEARIEASDNEYSFLHVVKPEIDLPESIDHFDPLVYETGKKNLNKLIATGIFLQDKIAAYYVYGQTLWNKTQYGLVGCASVQDYFDNIIRKHELTRPDKEDDRKNHIRITNFNAEPVFFAYPDNDKINAIIADIIITEPTYNFNTSDQVGHHFWCINKVELVKEIEKIFESEVPFTYVADGHHRTAAAAQVGVERKSKNSGHTGNEEYNFFLAVHFPASQLRIIDYNRAIKDLNGLTPEQFLDKICDSFKLEAKGPKPYKPQKLHEFSLYLQGQWYALTANSETYDNNHPINVLDVTVLSNTILGPVLGITDLRKSNRIDFIGGIRGLEELQLRVDSGEMAAAFALYPVTMQQLISIADSGNIMPPKTTWFEPKLRSGLVLHQLD